MMSVEDVEQYEPVVRRAEGTPHHATMLSDLLRARALLEKRKRPRTPVEARDHEDELSALVRQLGCHARADCAGWCKAGHG